MATRYSSPFPQRSIGASFFRSNGSSEVEKPFVQNDPEAVRPVTQRAGILSLDQILRKADEQHAGRVLESELERKNGRDVYEVEVVDDQGRVWEMKFDARTGEVLTETQGD